MPVIRVKENTYLDLLELKRTIGTFDDVIHFALLVFKRNPVRRRRISKKKGD